VAEQTEQDESRSSFLRRHAFALTCVVAGLLGFALGERGMLAASGSTPLSRVGFVLRNQNPEASPASWSALRTDLDAVRASFEPSVRPVFDLVVAVRGLGSGGNPEWTQAGEVCRRLKWHRCAQSDLEELARRSRP
jgi:hypothetical protein